MEHRFCSTGGHSFAFCSAGSFTRHSAAISGLPHYAWTKTALVLVAERGRKPGSIDRRDQYFGTDAVRRVDGRTRFTRVEIDHDALHAVLIKKVS